ncbi:hypothetical protein BD770DRAFT_138502 [Pilaira anomala]|nr:hypothetical protein BD770DRAFT_138502 [Pilaira anomala]
MTEEIKNRIKLDELKKRFRSAEEENDLLQEKLLRAQKSIKRLRLERSLLLDRIDNSPFGVLDDSDTGSDLLLHNELIEKHNTKNSYPTHNNNNNNTTVIKPPKKKKDPNAPKGPGNVFFLFCRLQRDKIKDENPEENIGDVTKLLGLKWKGLPKEEKQVYYDTFKKEMEDQSLDPADLPLPAESSSSNITSPDHPLPSSQLEDVVHLPTLSTMIMDSNHRLPHQSILPNGSIDNHW